ncbi:uncharacterized protein C17orf113-like [Littorina saxatilis]|uniref:uncharacterized protein C17orf113-like n=1 Tax=Littorina saxatilis TaxID=31220 RepID=UPI0038B5B43F
MKKQTEEKKDHDVSKLDASMRTAYYLAKEFIPNSKFSSLIELQALNGCKELTGKVYSHHSSVTEMQECLAAVLAKSQNLQDLNDSPFLGVMIDETVNVTVHKKLIVFLRFIKNGEPNTVFFGNHTITAGDAAHRVNLVASNAAKNTQKIADFRRTLNNIHFFFKNSAARYERLRELHRAFEDSGFVSLKEPCSVRWLSLTKATESVFAHWQELVLALGEEARTNATAEGILRQMQTHSFVAIMHMMLDILPIIDRLNKCFQEQDVNLSKIKPSVLSAKQRLTDHLEEAGQTEQGFDGARTGTYKTQNLTYCGAANIQAYQAVRTDFIQTLIDNLDERFPPDQLDILSSLGTIFDAKMYPVGMHLLRQFGTDALDVVLNKFAPLPNNDLPENERKATLVNRDRARRDFPELKYALHVDRTKSFAEVCKMVILDFPDQYPDFAVLANIAMTIPVSSVPCERGFSVQNAIKTQSRARLGDTTTDNLMLISMQGPKNVKCASFK